MADVLSTPPTPRPDDHNYLLSSSPIIHSPLPEPANSAFDFPSDPLGAPLQRCSPYPRQPADPPSPSESSTSSSPIMTSQFSRTSSMHSTAASSVSFENREEKDDEDFLPSYQYGSMQSRRYAPPPASSNNPTLQEPDMRPIPQAPEDSGTEDEESELSFMPFPIDDTALREEPTRQVDYLSHDWQETDIWASWKYLIANRRKYGQKSRLENAAWRTWAKFKFQLDTIDPEALNWLKECDVTWLYGPLQEARTFQSTSESTTNLSTRNSFLNKKPCLKRRSVSELMLQKSLSSSSLVKQAAAAVQAERSSRRNPQARLSTASSDISGTSTPPNSASAFVSTSSFPSTSSSGLTSPTNGRKHLRFDTTVEQCIAVDFKQPTDDEETSSWSRSDDALSEDDLLEMKPSGRLKGSNASSSRNSFSQESKGIVMLPSTTLKYREPEPNGPTHESSSFSIFGRPSLVSSASQETLRPPRPNANFLLDEDDDDMSWEPSGAFDGKSSSWDDDAVGTRSADGLRRTSSGMFMPDDDEDESSFASTGIVGRVVDTVNTARDIASILWNVGWRS